MLGTDDSELLSAYLDGEASADEFKRVNSLLASSAEHRQELERLTAMKATLSLAPRLNAPADLVATLLAHPRVAQRPKSWWSAFVPQSRPWILVSSAGLAASVFAVWTTVTAPWSPQPIPMQALLAAHARSATGTDAGLHGAMMAASAYSAQLAGDHASVN